MPTKKIFVGWTTVASAAAAHKLSAALVKARLATCVQVDGPITSHYRWQGRQERTKEWRLWVKFPANKAKALEAWLNAHHPYSTPQWLAVEAKIVAKSYRQWVAGDGR